MGLIAAKNGPLTMSRAMASKAWLQRLADANNILEMATITRTGTYRRASAYAAAQVAQGFADFIGDLYAHPEKTVIHEDLIPPEILFAMGLTPWMAELIGIAVPMIQADFAEQFIDEAENLGVPPDTCSLPKTTIGLALKDEMPQGVAMVTSNMPCDGGMASYTVLEKKLSIPTLRLDVPFNFYDERAVAYFADQLKDMVAWLEEHTPGRMDWDRLAEVCEERNRAAAYETELWDLLCEKPAPLAADAVCLSHLMFMIAMPGQPRSTKVFKKLLEYARAIRAAGKGALPDERYRAVLWNPPTLIYPELFVWAEQAYGVALIMDMLSYNRHPFVDTSSPDSMLKDLARIIMEGPMARHTRGPMENFFGDLFSLYERFSLDMIWMAGHIGCKNTMALSGIFRERCRERGIPLLVINYDLSDTRVVSPAGLRQQAESFMETVMKAERIGP
ncbi:MAG: 2-hydroxyacyl-CoA dehydratase [Deltaproteobacteria bacterium]|nr:2-hydroxyacyl-CoA dehydratase [Deltaproteobacteria bacterium]